MTVRSFEVLQTMVCTLSGWGGAQQLERLGMLQQVPASTKTRQQQQQQQLCETRRRSAVAETRARSVSSSNSKPEASLDTAGELVCGGVAACGVRFSLGRAFLTWLSRVATRCAWRHGITQDFQKQYQMQQWLKHVHVRVHASRKLKKPSLNINMPQFLVEWLPYFIRRPQPVFLKKENMTWTRNRNPTPSRARSKNEKSKSWLAIAQ